MQEQDDSVTKILEAAWLLEQASDEIKRLEECVEKVRLETYDRVFAMYERFGARNGVSSNDNLSSRLERTAYRLKAEYSGRPEPQKEI